MSDEPFQPPGGTSRPESGSWPYEPPGQQDASAAAAEVTVTRGHADATAGTPTVHPAQSRRSRRLVAVGVSSLLVGLAIGALTIDRPMSATPITVDSFPRELLGLTRDDVELRDGGSKTVLDRLDAHFEAQLNGYRFAYGGEGALFGYGEFTTLEIVNGQLAPEVPISDDTEWASSTVISLNTKDTVCISWEGTTSVQVYGTDDEMDSPLEAATEYAVARTSQQPFMYTDCVLFDSKRNLALRLNGEGSGDDILEAAGQFRDELKRIHGDLIS